MASKLHQLQSKAGQASQFLAKHGTAYYRQMMEQNKQYIQEPPTVEKCDLLAKQLLYTRLARLYPRTFVDLVLEFYVLLSYCLVDYLIYQIGLVVIYMPFLSIIRSYSLTS
ncbi:hypothetical protein CsSME_00050881 [Camellia sinensis var. sinensis]